MPNMDALHSTTSAQSLPSYIYNEHGQGINRDEKWELEWQRKAIDSNMASGRWVMLILTLGLSERCVRAWWTGTWGIIGDDPESCQARLIEDDTVAILSLSLEASLCVFLLGLLLLAFAMPTSRAIYVVLLVSWYLLGQILGIPPLRPLCTGYIKAFTMASRPDQDCDWATMRRIMYILVNGDCGIQGHSMTQFSLIWMLVSYFFIPSHRWMKWNWVYIFLVYTPANLLWYFSVDEANSVYKLPDILFSIVLLCVCQAVSSARKFFLEKSQRIKAKLDLHEQIQARAMLISLRDQLPDHVISPLLADPDKAYAQPIDIVSILFIMIDGFDERARTTEVKALLDFLNDTFSKWDDIMLEHNVTIIETVREEYVAAVGVLPEKGDEEIAELPKEQRDEVQKTRHLGHIKNLFNASVAVLVEEPDGMKIKMGVHSGEIYTGVIGQKLPRFRLFGDVINTTARMMQKSPPGTLQFGEETNQFVKQIQLPSNCQVVEQKGVYMKGKGEIDVYRLSLIETPNNSNNNDGNGSGDGKNNNNNNDGNAGSSNGDSANVASTDAAAAGGNVRSSSSSSTRNSNIRSSRASAAASNSDDDVEGFGAEGGRFNTAYKSRARKSMFGGALGYAAQKASTRPAKQGLGALPEFEASGKRRSVLGGMNEHRRSSRYSVVGHEASHRKSGRHSIRGVLSLMGGDAIHKDEVKQVQRVEKAEKRASIRASLSMVGGGSRSSITSRLSLSRMSLPRGSLPGVARSGTGHEPIVEGEDEDAPPSGVGIEMREVSLSPKKARFEEGPDEVVEVESLHHFPERSRSYRGNEEAMMEQESSYSLCTSESMRYEDSQFDEYDEEAVAEEEAALQKLMKEISKKRERMVPKWRKWKSFMLRTGFFNDDMERAWFMWQHQNFLCHKMRARLQRAEILVLVMSIFDFVVYIYFYNWYFVPFCPHRLYGNWPPGRSLVFLISRALAYCILALWKEQVKEDFDGDRRSTKVIEAEGWFFRRPYLAQWGTALSYVFLIFLFFLSYDAISNAQENWVDNLQSRFGVEDSDVLSENFAARLKQHWRHTSINSFMFFFASWLLCTSHPWPFGICLIFPITCVACGFLLRSSFWMDGSVNLMSLYYSQTVMHIIFIVFVLLFGRTTYHLEKDSRGRFKALKNLEETRHRFENILSRLMPPKILEEMSELPPGQKFPSHPYKCCTVAQSDLSGFTALASTCTPEQVVELVSDLFGRFDKQADLRGVWKVETVGDAYIAAAAEAPLTESNKAINVVVFGQDMIREVHAWSMANYIQVTCRVGVAHGECIGGIASSHMRRYHLFGDLMSVVEVLESTGALSRVQISPACYEKVQKELREDGPLGVELEVLGFTLRSEDALFTSKGETHHYDEVGGRTYLVDFKNPLPAEPPLIQRPT